MSNALQEPNERTQLLAESKQKKAASQGVQLLLLVLYRAAHVRLSTRPSITFAEYPQTTPSQSVSRSSSHCGLPSSSRLSIPTENSDICVIKYSTSTRTSQDSDREVGWTVRWTRRGRLFSLSLARPGTCSRD